MTRKEWLARGLRKIKVIQKDEDLKEKRVYIDGVDLNEYVQILNDCLDMVQENMDPAVIRVSRWVDEYYKKALEDDTVRKPMSWALYKAWRRMDTKEVER